LPFGKRTACEPVEGIGSLEKPQRAFFHEGHPAPFDAMLELDQSYHVEPFEAGGDASPRGP